ncbi:MAG: flavodoxin domain-containing protein [Candidatus Heimdallarchaeota archaeon]|nr:flavodoxin domain-containing protein [Candidatus Heimdallarchaeota archaeon]
MGKAIVIYNTRSGNTEKVATKIAEGLGADLVSYKEIPDLKKYDLIVFGSWLIFGTISPGGKKFMKKLDAAAMKGKKAALFITAGSPEQAMKKKGKEILQKDVAFNRMEEILETKGAKVVKERFAVVGAYKFIRRGPGSLHKGHPTEEEFQQSIKFGESLKKKYLK